MQDGPKIRSNAQIIRNVVCPFKKGLNVPESSLAHILDRTDFFSEVV